MKTTVIHHSADYDGIFCREIARKFLPDAELIGWDFADKPLPIPTEGMVYVLDLPVDRVFGFDFNKPETVEEVVGDQAVSIVHAIKDLNERLVWIDHHKSSIESHPKEIPGYRIDGVAACRLAWQWFTAPKTMDMGIPALESLPTKQIFLERNVPEPLAVRLAGEYDIWDHRGDGDLEFQFGLDATPNLRFDLLLYDTGSVGFVQARTIVARGESAMNCYAKRDADVMRTRSFLRKWEGLTFLCLNTAKCNSQTFAALDNEDTGHDALLAFFYNGEKFQFSLYHAAHRTDIDLSVIAKKHGGGGHKGACGFLSQTCIINPDGR